MKVSHAARRPRPGGVGPRTGLFLAPGTRVGLYGGSFNPTHAGHLQVAATARKRLGIDRVIWLVSPGNPLKQTDAPLGERLAGARRAGAREVSDVEARLGSRYTIDTVRRMKARYPAVRFVWIMGADNLAQFDRWRDWAGLMAEVPIAVVARPGASLAALTSPAARRFAAHRLPGGAGRRLALATPPAWIYLTAPWNPASSSAVRNSTDPKAGP